IAIWGTIVALALFIYYRDITQKLAIEQLSRKNDTLVLENESAKKVIKGLNLDFEKIRETNQIIQSHNILLLDETKKLEDTLYRERHGKKSLDELALKKTQ